MCIEISEDLMDSIRLDKWPDDESNDLLKCWYPTWHHILENYILHNNGHENTVYINLYQNVVSIMVGQRISSHGIQHSKNLHRL